MIIMTDEMMKLKGNAEYYRDLYRIGKCSREVAKEEIMPYLDKVNEKAMELSKKYKQKYKPVSFSSFVR